MKRSDYEAALEPMLGPLGSIDELASGTTGTTYLVETGAGRFAAKAFAADSLALLSPAQQFEVLETLAETGITPRPAGFDTEARLLVTEYLADASAVGPESLRQGERIADVVAGLRLLHGVTVNIPRFDPVADEGVVVTFSYGDTVLQGDSGATIVDQIPCNARGTQGSVSLDRDGLVGDRADGIVAYVRGGTAQVDSVIRSILNQATLNPGTFPTCSIQIDSVVVPQYVTERRIRDDGC